MKRTTQLTICATLAAVMVAQVASAGVLFTNQVRAVKGVGVRLNYATPPTFVTAYDKVAMRCDTAGQSGKSWLAWDLSGYWSLYGKMNLTNASFTIWSENGTGRNFKVAALQDSLGLDGWDQATLHWTNAPGNTAVNLVSEPDPGSTIARQQLVWSKIYNATNLWEANGNGVDLARPDLGSDYDQCARYTSPSGTVNSNLMAFLTTDTDGMVTLIGVGGSSQNWFVGTNGYYTNDIAAGRISTLPATLGQQIRDTPTLTLVFDVRVALTGGGTVCPGDPGLDVSMAGTDAGYDYLLYTNGVYSQTVPGTGAAASFGLQTAGGTYTAMSSNTTTTVVAPVPGNVAISAPVLPAFLVQPAPNVAATNSVAIYSSVAVSSSGGYQYQWFRNGVDLTNDSHYSGTTTAQLKISPVLASDAATATDGYYVRIINACGNVAYSTTNALTVQVARDLVWDGAATNIWDVATTVNWWLNTAGGTATAFNSGDNVTLDGNGVAGVNLVNPDLAPGVITFNSTGAMGIISDGFGKIAGPNSSLVVNGPSLSSQLIISNANTFGGGVTINDGWLTLQNLQAVGTNTITMAGTGYSLLEAPLGNFYTFGINVTADSVLQINGNGGTAVGLGGAISGTPGKKLTVKAPNALAGSNLRITGNFTCAADIFLDFVNSGVNWAPYQSGTNIFNGVISGGNGVLYPRSGTTILSGSNTFSYTLISQGHVGVGIDSDLYGASPYSPLGLGTFTQDNQGDNGIFAWGGARTVENPFTWRNTGANRQFTTLGTNQLTMSGAFDLSNGTNNTIRPFNIGNTAPTILSGVISDAGQNMGINKTGNGALYLNNGGNSYGNTTTVSAGRLAGSGNIPGALAVNGGAVGGGSAAAIGNLTVGGNMTLATNGGGFFRVNRSGSQSDTVSVAGTLANTGTGTITITNLGADLQVGDTFTIFNKPVTGGGTMKITGAKVNWVNNLAVDGSVQVLNVIATYPTNISYNVSGSTLTMSWPITHLSWSLQAQTNALNKGLSTNWGTIPGTASVTSTNIVINPANPAVFYRLFYVAP